MKKVLGMGAALVDILANVSDEWIQAQGVQKGGMNMVDWPQMEKFLGALDNPIRVPGGSTCNTMVGLSRLHGKAAFISKIGDDELGKLFQEHLKNNGVESKLGMSDVATGCVFSAVTPDAQRSMWTYLGRSRLRSHVASVSKPLSTLARSVWSKLAASCSMNSSKKR